MLSVLVVAVGVVFVVLRVVAGVVVAVVFVFLALFLSLLVRVLCFGCFLVLELVVGKRVSGF